MALEQSAVSSGRVGSAESHAPEMGGRGIRADKAGGEHAYDPLGALYSLLEHDTAGSFIDEFAEVPIDASQVIWVATASRSPAPRSSSSRARKWTWKSTSPSSSRSLSSSPEAGRRGTSSRP